MKTIADIAIQLKKESCFCNCETPKPACLVDIGRFSAALLDAETRGRIAGLREAADRAYEIAAKCLDEK